MNYDLIETPLVGKKIFSNPEEIALRLQRQRYSRPDAGMDEEEIPTCE
jgi:hypothetical protein